MRWLIPLPYGKELHEWFFRFLCLGGGDIRPQSRTKAYASDAAFCLVATEKLTPDSVLALAVRYNRSFGYSSSSAVSLFDAYVSDVLSICSLINDSFGSEIILLYSYINERKRRIRRGL